jgi:hypothetical protein
MQVTAPPSAQFSQLPFGPRDAPQAPPQSRPLLAYSSGAEDVARLVGEHAVDVVASPVAVLGMHFEPRSAECRIGKVADRVLREERAIHPRGSETRLQVIRVRLRTVQLLVVHRCECRIAPAGLERLESRCVGVW